MQIGQDGQDAMASGEGEEDDYMSMTIVEPEKAKEKETYSQRRIRKEREAEIKGHPKSKKELEADAAAVRNAALASSLPKDSKGYKMMAKLGYKEGGVLGATYNAHARTEPIELALKEDRGGIGLDSEKKRKFREEADGVAKKAKADETEFRDRVARERMERRLEGQFYGAMKVAEKLDNDEEAEDDTPGGKEESYTGLDDLAPSLNATSDTSTVQNGTQSNKISRKPNILWRQLMRERREKERDQRMRRDLLQSLSENSKHDDPEEDADDRLALGREEGEEESNGEDPELDEFMASELEERVEKLVEYLRTKYHYCFWCKNRYADSSMDGCPGPTEDEHG